MAGALIGIEIGGSKLQLVAGDASGLIQDRIQCPVDVEKGAQGIRSQIRSSLKKLFEDHSPKAIGVGFGGPVDWSSGLIVRSHQIEGWDHFNLKTWLEEIGELPALVENDANAAALGETARGAGRNSDPVFYMTIGSGIGGGLVVNGQIYHGAKPGECEIGHVRLDRQGNTLESFCSGWALDRRIRGHAQSHPEGLLAELCGSETGGETRHLAAALSKHDHDAVAILNEVCGHLAYCLSHVSHLFHPETIVLGGGVALLGEPLRYAVEQHLKTFVMEAHQPGPAVRLAELKEDAVPVGALLLASQIQCG